MSTAWGSVTERPSWMIAVCAAEAPQVGFPLRRHAEHRANSDKDCDGVCFGTNVSVCSVHMNATESVVTLRLGVTRDTYNTSTSLTLSNTGIAGRFLGSRRLSGSLLLPVPSNHQQGIPALRQPLLLPPQSHAAVTHSSGELRDSSWRESSGAGESLSRASFRRDLPLQGQSQRSRRECTAIHCLRCSCSSLH